MDEKIYRVRIPVSSRGRPRWHRTGELRARESAQAVGVTIILRNAAAHAGPRRDLGTPRGRPIRSPGVQVVDWQAEARDRLRGELLEARRAATFRALEKP